jgi:hypothetical protein
MIPETRRRENLKSHRVILGQEISLRLSSLSCSQQPATGPYSQPNEFNHNHPRPVSVFSSCLHLGLPPGFPTFYTYLSSLPMLATRPAHLTLTDSIIIFFSWKVKNTQLPHPPVISSLLGPNNLNSALFSNLTPAQNKWCYSFPYCNLRVSGSRRGTRFWTVR